MSDPSKISDEWGWNIKFEKIPRISRYGQPVKDKNGNQSFIWGYAVGANDGTGKLMTAHGELVYDTYNAFYVYKNGHTAFRNGKPIPNAGIQGFGNYDISTITPQIGWGPMFIIFIAIILMAIICYKYYNLRASTGNSIITGK
jgi:hypothetical protein